MVIVDVEALISWPNGVVQCLPDKFILTAEKPDKLKKLSSGC